MEIYINSSIVDTYEDTGIKMQHNFFNPTDINRKTSTYSYSISLPVTRNNSLIFSHAEVAEQKNKFTGIYDAKVYEGGTMIFEGHFRLSEITAREYKGNLISLVQDNLTELFGDMTMNKLKWDVPFVGANSITDANADMNEKYYFPLVSYGAFQKVPKETYGNEVNTYTDLLTIDDTTRLYFESFYPSVNLPELIRKLYEQKGWNVAGNFFTDKVLDNVYLSTSIGDNDDPSYNLDNPLIGNIKVAGQFNNYGDASTFHGLNRGQDLAMAVQDLKYGKEPYGQDLYNFDRIVRYDILGTKADTSYHKFTTQPTNDYLYRRASLDDSSGFIYIPSTGLYKITVTITGAWKVNETPTTAKVKELLYGEEQEKTINVNVTNREMPIEIHLVRNNLDTELIYGKDENGFLYPHEPDYTKYSVNSAPSRNAGNGNSRTSSSSVNSSNRGTFTGNNRTSAVAHALGGKAFVKEKYYPVPTTTSMQLYDPYASENFICGFSTIAGMPSVMRNGASWNASITDYNQNHYNSDGYLKETIDGTVTKTDYGRNTLEGAPQSYMNTTAVMTGKVTTVMELNKNDRLTLQAVTRCYNDFKYTYQSDRGQQTVEEDGDYKIRVDYEIEIEPYSSDVNLYVNRDTIPYEKPSYTWGFDLNLGHFFRSDEKVSDFIQNVINSFNVRYNVSGNTAIFNIGKLPRNTGAWVDLDSKADTYEATFTKLDFPKSMAVTYDIDEEEAGAYRSCPIEYQATDEYSDHIDRGYDTVITDLTADSEATTKTGFSYTWYENFTYGDNTIRMPIIIKDEWFIIQNDDAMQHDGLSLKKRLWFRKRAEDYRLPLWNGQQVRFSVPTDAYEGVKMNYKHEEGTLLDRYFNMPRNPNNLSICEIECPLSIKEYTDIVNGALIKFNHDLYRMNDMTYDVRTGKSTIKMCNFG